MTNRFAAALEASSFALLLCSAAITASVQADTKTYDVRMLPLPGASPAGISMDYIAYDPGTRTVWVPAGNSGRVDVVDVATGKVREISGFATAEMGTGDRKRIAGPSGVTIGRGMVFIGNRGDSSVCAIDSRTLARGVCHTLDSSPDGLSYVASTKEVWVTTPRDNSLRILDATTLREKAKLTYEGNPEGFAVDEVRHRFYTNLENKDLTLAIDLKTHKTVATWKPACGEDGPHGIRLDEKAGHLFVACSARAEVIDVAHDGKVLSSADTGDGVDDIDYWPATHELFVGAAKTGELTILHVDRDGKLTVAARVPTKVGARNAAAAPGGVIYLAHSGREKLSDLVVVTPRK
jgi:DNA-binding beta-propeller fold protein YncE